MSKDLVILTVHGIGDTKRRYWHSIRAGLKKYLGDSDYKRLHIQPVYYAPVLQNRQDEIWHKSRRGMRWKKIRRFVMSSIADAATLEHKAYLPGSSYFKVQAAVLRALETALMAAVDATTPVAIFAHSLGAHVISSYIWDGFQESAVYGIWRKTAGAGIDRRTNEGRFLALRTTRLFITAGCNIPLFVSGFDSIEPFPKPRPDFEWLNYYDRDDVLGWPLGPLGPAFEALVVDRRVNVAGALTNWNPLSHTAYWKSKEVMQPASLAVAKVLASLSGQHNDR